jgi:hypothetical protein
MKSKSELQTIVDQIACPSSPVGMDAVYVHAVIIDKLQGIERQLAALQAALGTGSAAQSPEPSCVASR